MIVTKLTKKDAINFYDNIQYRDLTFDQIAVFQINNEFLLVPFSLFREALEKTLDRPVFTHEFGMNYDGLLNEVIFKIGAEKCNILYNEVYTLFLIKKGKQ